MKKRKIVKTADGVPVKVGMKLWDRETKTSGRAWFVTGPHRVTKVGGFGGGWKYSNDWWHTTLGENRSYSTKERAEVACAKAELEFVKSGMAKLLGLATDNLST